MRNGFLRALAVLATVGAALGATGSTSAAAATGRSFLRADELFVELQCGRFLNDETRCSTTVYGATGEVGYSWVGAQPLEYDPSSAIAECYYGQYHYVEVVVTDSNGNTGDAWLSFQC